MGEPEGGRPFYEHRRFQGTVAVVGLLGAVWALVGAPKPWDAIGDLFSSELPSSNTEIVLDASGVMADSFAGSGTKLDAAVGAVGQHVAPFRNEGFALRVSGGGCDEAGDLVVDFGEDHGDDVRDAAAEQRPGGSSHLTNAVIAAIDDFADSERFDPDSRKRVLVFAGTDDECRGPNASDEVRRELERTGIDAVFKLVGVDVAKEDRERLRALRDSLGARAEVVFADTPAELEEAAEPPTGATGITGPQD
jgi:hypothetical protein